MIQGDLYLHCGPCTLNMGVMDFDKAETTAMEFFTNNGLVAQHWEDGKIGFDEVWFFQTSSEKDGITFKFVWQDKDS